MPPVPLFASLLLLQAEGSCYELVEARLGGSLTRHDVGVEQAGPDTTTTMKHFILAGAGWGAAPLCCSALGAAREGEGEGEAAGKGCACATRR